MYIFSFAISSGDVFPLKYMFSSPFQMESYGKYTLRCTVQVGQ